MDILQTLNPLGGASANPLSGSGGPITGAALNRLTTSALPGAERLPGVSDYKLWELQEQKFASDQATIQNLGFLLSALSGAAGAAGAAPSGDALQALGAAQGAKKKKGKKKGKKSQGAAQSGSSGGGGSSSGGASSTDGAGASSASGGGGATGSTGKASSGKPSGNIVDVPGGKVDASIAGNVKEMMAAAKKDGVELKINSSYRSRAEQEKLYAAYKNGTGNLAAKPGSSNHESGLAIDFAGTPGAFEWLKKNAGRFGLKNLPGEPWHYSTTGS